MRLVSLLALFAACAAAPLAAQAAAPTLSQTAKAKAPFVKTDAEAAVRELATALEENFVFPDKGNAYAAMLRAKLDSGAYSVFPDAEAFASRVTADLQAVHADGHLRLRFVFPEERSAPQSPSSGPLTESGVVKSGWVTDGVAYIRFDGFPGNEATLSDVRKFIGLHGSAANLIIDARHHRGGGLDEMNLLFERLFAKPTVLVQMDIRLAVEEKHGTPFADDDPVLPKIAGPQTIIRRQHIVTPATPATALRDAKVYLLTSNKTASAAEHFALSLKRTRRATLIGEATSGAGHFGGMIPMGKSYAAFIPVGRTFDPDTGEGWEGVGVKPDVEVPADKALDEALKLAGVNKSAEVALAELK